MLDISPIAREGMLALARRRGIVIPGIVEQSWYQPDPDTLPKPQEGPQTAFLECDADIVIYGGAAGGGKSFGLFLEAASIRDCPTARFVYFRRQQTDINKAGGPWDKSLAFFPLYGATPNRTSYKWRFPSGCEGQFASLQYDTSLLGWQTTEIDVLLFDELTHFTERQFWYMQSRLRNVSGVRTRTKAGTNPAPGWVKKLLAPWVDADWPDSDKSRPGEIRYLARIDGETVWVDADWRYSTGDKPKSITFIRSSIYDNRILLDADRSYVTNLLSQTAVEKARLLDGDWSVTDGSFFDMFTQAEHYVPALHTPKGIDGAEPPEWWVYCAGFDWGYDDPSAFVLCGVSETGCVHVLESWERSRCTNETYAGLVCSTLSRWGVAKELCIIVADQSMWSRRTINAVQAEPDVDAFFRAGLSMTPGEHGAEANRARNSQIRAFLDKDRMLQVYRGYNSRLVECLEGAQHATHDNEQVEHDEFSHLIFALGCALSTRPKPTAKPASDIDPHVQAAQYLDILHDKARERYAERDSDDNRPWGY